MDKRNGILQPWEKTPSLSNTYIDEEIKELKFQGAAEANTLWAGPVYKQCSLNLFKCYLPIKS